MNTTTKKIIAAGALGAIALTSLSAVSANYVGASDDIPDNIKIEDTDISRAEILKFLKSEVAELTDATFRKKISESVATLEKVTDDAAFNEKIEDIFLELDDHYGDRFEEDSEKPFDFESYRSQYISGLSQELKYVKDDTVKKQVQSMIGELSSITQEDAFFTKLESIYAILDAHYESTGENMKDLNEDMSFEDVKKEILGFLAEENVYVKDFGFDITDDISKIKAITDENKFFAALDGLYEKIEKLFEKHEIEMEYANEGDVSDESMENMFQNIKEK